MSEIERYRQGTREYLKTMKGNRSDIGLWSPACVQHGFSDERSFTDEHFKVKGVGLAEAVQRFLDNPTEAPWLVDEDPWPSNSGCSGLSTFRKIRRY